MSGAVPTGAYRVPWMPFAQGRNVRVRKSPTLNSRILPVRMTIGMCDVPHELPAEPAPFLNQQLRAVFPLLPRPTAREYGGI
jgi:hypothetical protein